MATAGLILCCLEWWVGEILTFMSGYLDENNQALAASVIVNALTLSMSYLTLSFSFTLSALIGGALGQGNI